MKPKNTKILVALTLLLPASALAQVTPAPQSLRGGSVGSGNDRLIWTDEQCDHCPTQPKEPGTLSFAEAEELYKRGTAPNEEQLKSSGPWKNTLSVSLPNVPKIFWNTEDGVRPNGFKNSDGSDRTSLSFDRIQASEWGADPLAVTISGIGKSNSSQGPHEVVPRADAACFAQYGYSYYSDGSSTLNRDAYFSYACRMLSSKNSKKRMICAMSPEGENSSAWGYSQRLYLGKTISYRGYTAE